MTKKYDIASMMDTLMTRNTALFSKPAEPMVKKASLQQKESLSAYERAINSLAKISEVCDDAGLTKTASIVLASLETLISEAKKKPNKLVKDHLDKKKGKKDDKKKADKKKDKKDDKKDDKKKGKKPAFLFKKKEEKVEEEVESEEDDSKKKVSDEDSNEASDAALDFDLPFDDDYDDTFETPSKAFDFDGNEITGDSPDKKLPTSDDWLSGRIDEPEEDVGFASDDNEESEEENKLEKILGPDWKEKIKKLKELGWEGDTSDITSASDEPEGAKCKECGDVFEYEDADPDFVCRPCRGSKKIEAIKPDWSKKKPGNGHGAVVNFPGKDKNSDDDGELVPEEFNLHSLLDPEPKGKEEPVDEDLPELFDLKSASSKDNMHLVFAALKSAAEKKVDPKAKVRNRAGAIFSSKHPKVKDKKDHFPIDTIGRGRNALARSHQFSGAPSWWSGSLKELQSAVSKAVHGKYPAIKSEKKDKKDKK